DVLAWTNPDPGTMTGGFNPSTGAFTIGGSDTRANYQAALDSVTFYTTSGSSGTRTVSVGVTDGVGSSTQVSRHINVSTAVAPSVTQTPTGTTVNAGSMASFTAAASGTPAPAVLWDVSTDGGSTWNPASGTNNQPTYTIAATTAGMNGDEYKAVFTNSAG